MMICSEFQNMKAMHLESSTMVWCGLTTSDSWEHTLIYREQGMFMHKDVIAGVRTFISDEESHFH